MPPPISSFLRAVAWLLLGGIFGLSLILFILATSLVFEQGDHPITTEALLNPEILIFLCVTLMAGAGSDFVLSFNTKNTLKGWVASLIIVLTIGACVLFMPQLKPKNLALNYIKIGYGVITVWFCVWAKAQLFLEEKLNKRRRRYPNFYIQ
jgi:hypothetical protein